MSTDPVSTSFERTELNPAQKAVMDRLGAAPRDRPTFDPSLQREARLELERELAPLVAALGEENLFLAKGLLERSHGCEVRFVHEDDLAFEWSPATARGAVAHKAVELAVTTRADPLPLDLVDEAIASLTNEGRGVGAWLQTATPTEINDVRAQANSHLTLFQECWPPLERRWRPATEVPLRADLFEGRIVLSGRPDLTLGRADGQRAGKVIVDFKTGSTSPGHRHDLHFYALLDLLRIGTPPRLLVTYYLDRAELHSEEVTEDLLDAAIRRTIAGARQVIGLRFEGREPSFRPGPGCRWCPLINECEQGSSHLNDTDDLA